MSVHHFPQQGTAARAATDALVRALLDPQAYPHPVQPIRHIETHISHLFLTGRYAYKIKKPLQLPFLDYSSLAQRRAACEDELRLNRRTAAALYLSVEPIGQSATGPRVGVDSNVLDYAVKMRQFCADQLYSDLLERDALTPAHIDVLAQAVAAFHAALPAADVPLHEADVPLPGADIAPPTATLAPPTPHNATPADAGAARIHAWTIENFTALEEHAGTELRARLHALRAWFDRTFIRLESTFRARQSDGHVRECHGDLHLANVTLIDDAPVLFDCIEFNPALRWIDTINEAAFVFMDLLHGERTDYAYRFLNGYLEQTGDYAGVALLRYYAGYRALVRAKVAALRARQGNSAQSLAQMQAQMHSYLALAERIARSHQPWLILTHGLSGSGKTTVAQHLLAHLPAVRVRSDIERKRLHGLAGTASSGSALGEGVYGAAATAQTFARLAELARSVLAAGESVIVDATFLRRAVRSAFRALADEHGVPLVIVSCTAPRPVLERRVRERRADASEADLQVLAQQFELHEPIGPDEAMHTFTLDTDCPTAALGENARQLAAALQQERP